MMKGHREHEHLIISSPDLTTSSKHRTTHQPSPYPMNTLDDAPSPSHHGASSHHSHITPEPFPSPSPSYSKQ